MSPLHSNQAKTLKYIEGCEESLSTLEGLCGSGALQKMAERQLSMYMYLIRRSLRPRWPTAQVEKNIPVLLCCRESAISHTF